MAAGGGAACARARGRVPAPVARGERRRRMSRLWSMCEVLCDDAGRHGWEGVRRAARGGGRGWIPDGRW